MISAVVMAGINAKIIKQVTKDELVERINLSTGTAK